jgi:hypothetical protein
MSMCSLIANQTQLIFSERIFFGQSPTEQSRQYSYKGRIRVIILAVKNNNASLFIVDVLVTVNNIHRVLPWAGHVARMVERCIQGFGGKT